ncbi:CGNR zinc finger [compost metagenome]
MPKKIAPSFCFIGNHLALDFMNTKVVADGKLVDLLQTSDDVWNWLNQTDLLVDQPTDSETQWRAGSSLVEEAIELRTALHAILLQGMQGAEAAFEEVERVNRFLRSKVITTTLLQQGGQFFSVRHIEAQRPADLLLPVAEAAVDLLTKYDLRLVKKCENPQCVLHFYDNSKNSTRRWCSQKTCGNRMKVAAYLERRKRAENEETKNPG